MFRHFTTLYIKGLIGDIYSAFSQAAVQKNSSCTVEEAVRTKKIPNVDTFYVVCLPTFCSSAVLKVSQKYKTSCDRPIITTQKNEVFR